MTLKARVGVAIAAALAGGVLVSACGSADSDAAGTDTKSAKSDKSEELTEDNFIDRLSSAYRDKGSTQVRTKLDTKNFAVTADGQIEFAGSAEDDQIAMTLKRSGTNEEQLNVRIMGSELYAQTPDSAGRFVNVDLTDNKDPEWAEVDKAFDVDERLDVLLESATDFTKVDKTAEIRGTTVQPYRITVDSSTLTDKKWLLEMEVLKDASNEIAYTVFVDADDVIHRIKMNTDDDNGFVMNFTDWGDPVSIDKPDPSKVVSP